MVVESGESILAMNTRIPHSVGTSGKVITVFILGIFLYPEHRAYAEDSGGGDINLNGVAHVPIGSLKERFGFEAVVKDGPWTSLENRKVKIRMIPGKPEIEMNGVLLIQASPVVEKDGDVLVSRADVEEIWQPTLVPFDSSGSGNFQTVILDPAGGGKGEEGYLTLKMAELLKGELEQREFRVVMTRTENKVTPDEARVGFANGIAEDAIYIRIAFASGKEGMQGMSSQVFSPAPAGKNVSAGEPESFSSAAMALAVAVHGTTVRAFGKNTRDGGISRETAAPFARIKHPAICLNAGYLSHPYEAKLIASHPFQKAFARSVAGGVDKYRAAVSGRGRSRELKQQPSSEKSGESAPTAAPDGLR